MMLGMNAGIENKIEKETKIIITNLYLEGLL